MLLSILRHSDLTINEVADILKITPEYVCRILSGDRPKGGQLGAVIERMYHGIRLKVAAKDSFGSLTAAAQALDISGPYLTQICQGQRNPSPQLAYRIEAIFNGGIKAYQLLINPEKAGADESL